MRKWIPVKKARDSFKQIEDLQMFSIGQKVVCVDDDFDEGQITHIPDRQIKGNVYTIRQIDIGRTWNHNLPVAIVLYLKGLNNPASDHPPYKERGFDSKRFRPLTEEEKQNKQKNTCHKKNEEKIFLPA